MRKKLFLLFIFILSINETAYGKGTHKTKINTNHKETAKNSERSKRSAPQINEKPFWAKEKNVLMPNNIDDIGDGTKVDFDAPFWGTRGRRDSSSNEYYNDRDYPIMIGETKFYKGCARCSRLVYNLNSLRRQFAKTRRDEPDSPFWGNRGRRNSEEYGYTKYFNSDSNKDKNEDDPFWGTRGRRLETSESPFWGARSRRDNTVIRPDSPFWGSRGRRDEDDEAFWGSRGRRDDPPPFWGNRGRRQDTDDSLKDSLLNAINIVENDIEKLSRMRRTPNSFWINRGRNSQLKSLFGGARYKIPKLIRTFSGFGVKEKPTEASTLLDDRIYAEQPSYLLVERSSRSSSEDDPFYISRGKKRFFDYRLFKAARDRRGAIEDLVKSVRNDPFYIARGKKDQKTNSNTTNPKDDLNKVKELICSTIDLITIKNEEKVKRDVTDNDRDRRTILKKLAAQLQMDPYFVSRGKKSDGLVSNEDTLEEFINDIAAKCH